MTNRHPDFNRLEKDFGIFLPGVVGYTSDIAMDSQSPLITSPNNGIPAWLANYFDPKVINILVTPNKAATIFGEAQKGDWTTKTATFVQLENTGSVSAYDDFSEDGMVGANATFPQRQSYSFQTLSVWGDLQVEMNALARLDYVSAVNKSSAMALDKFLNNSYFFGVSGLQNYGLLNDGSLSAPIGPGPKAYNSNSAGPWITNGVGVTATANEVYNDIQNLFLELVSQTNGLVQADSKMVLALSPASAVALTATNSFNVNVRTLLEGNFPNIRIETAVQYATGSGNLVQLIAEDIEGEPTGYCAYSHKLMAHRIVPAVSSFKQKKSAGSFGAIILKPMAVAGLLGV